MRHSSVRIVVLACVLLAAVPDRAAVAGSDSRTITVGHIARTYLRHVPRGGSGALPVVIGFHGSATTAAQIETMTRFSELADREGFVAVYPQAIEKSWYTTGRNPVDVAFVRALVDDLAGTVGIDRRRVFAAGISNGAQMAWQIACAAPDLVAAVGLVAGGYPKVCGDRRPPAIIFHGTADRLLPYGGRDGHRPIREFAAAWGAPADCAGDAIRGAVIFRKGDATAERWSCGRFEAVLYTLSGKGHTWPGSSAPDPTASRDVDASDAMWRFFRSVVR